MVRGYLSLSKEEPAVQQRRPTARTLAGRTGTPHRRRRSRRRSRREVKYPTTAKLKRREEKCRCGRRRGGDPPSPPVGERRSGARQLVGGAPATVPPGRSDPRRRGSARAEDVAPAKRGTPRATQHQNARAARWGHTVSRLRLAGATQAPPAGASPAAREGSHRRRCARSATAAPDALEVVRHSRPRPLLTCRSGSGRGAGRGAAARGAGAGSAGLGSAGHLRSHHAANAVSWCHCMERLLRPGADEVVHHERRRVDARASETGQRRSSREVVVTSRHARSRRAQCFSTCGHGSRWTKRDAPSSGTHAPEGRAAGRVRRISPQHEGREGDEGDAIATRSRSGARLGRTRVSESRTSRRPHAACTHVMCTHNL